MEVLEFTAWVIIIIIIIEVSEKSHKYIYMYSMTNQVYHLGLVFVFASLD